MVTRPTGNCKYSVKETLRQNVSFDIKMFRCEASMTNQLFSTVTKKIRKCSVKVKQKINKSHPCLLNLFDL